MEIEQEMTDVFEEKSTLEAIKEFRRKRKILKGNTFIVATIIKM